MIILWQHPRSQGPFSSSREEPGNQVAMAWQLLLYQFINISYKWLSTEKTTHYLLPGGRGLEGFWGIT